MELGDLEIRNPEWLFLLLLLPLMMWLRSRRGARVLVVPFSSQWHRPSLLLRPQLPIFLIYTGIVFAVAGMCRPQIIRERVHVNQEGYDIILAIDLSGSMLAEDYNRYGVTMNRLQAIKPIIETFIRERVNDRIGIVVFAGRAFTMAPLTFDKEWLSRQTQRLSVNLIVEDGTAIGDGVGLAVSRLELKSRQAQDDNGRVGAFVILLTDGAHNGGMMTPKQAADLARDRKIKVYTIGAGSRGQVAMPAFDRNGVRVGTSRMQSDLDEPTLKEMAKLTGGAYFRAYSVDTAERAFAVIDKQEKVEFEAQYQVRSMECFQWLALPGMLCCVLGIVGLCVGTSSRVAMEG